MAYHEAGHAVIIHLNGGVVKRISIDCTDARRGVESAPSSPPDTRADPAARLDDLFTVLVAGEASGILYGTAESLASTGSRVDYEQALHAPTRTTAGHT